ncbi:RxLR effector protein, partial [Phytophthora megakarya]
RSSMQTHYVLIVVVSTFLATSEAMLVSKNSNQPEAFQDAIHSTDVVDNPIGKRFLRSNIDKSNGDERSWATIAGVARDKANAKEWLHYWLRQTLSADKVATKLGITSFNQQHENWNALVKYVRTNFKWATGEKMPRTEAEDYLRGILIANGH